MHNDTEYLRKRITEELEAAAEAQNLCARNRHLEFAAAYAFRVREIDARSHEVTFQLQGSGSFADLADSQSTQPEAVTASHARW